MNRIKSIVIVPTYCEVDNIAALVEGIKAAVPTAHILFVDDNSSDGTVDIIRTQITIDPEKIHLLLRKEKLGLGSAYIDGFKWALDRSYTHLVEMDADMSHNPNYLPLLIDLLNSYDFVIGSRYVSGGGVVNWSWLRRIVSIGGSFYARTILGAPIRDFTGGFNGWRDTTLRQIDFESLSSDGYAFQIELKYRAHKAGLMEKEFPILFEDRRAGQSKMSLNILLEAIWRVWSFRFRAATVTVEKK